MWYVTPQKCARRKFFFSESHDNDGLFIYEYYFYIAEDTRYAGQYKIIHIWNCTIDLIFAIVE